MNVLKDGRIKKRFSQRPTAFPESSTMAPLSALIRLSTVNNPSCYKWSSCYMLRSVECLLFTPHKGVSLRGKHHTNRFYKCNLCKFHCVITLQWKTLFPRFGYTTEMAVLEYLDNVNPTCRSVTSNSYP